MKSDDIKKIVSDVIDEKKLATQEKIIEFKDAILHEIKALREETTIVTGYKDQLEDHETRLEKLESVAFPQ